MNKPAPKVIVKKGGKAAPVAVSDNDADDKPTARDAILARLKQRSK